VGGTSVAEGGMIASGSVLVAIGIDWVCRGHSAHTLDPRDQALAVG